MIYVRICFLIALSFASFKGLNYLLTIFQQEHYNTKKYIKSFYDFYFLKKYNYLFYIMVFISFLNNAYLYIGGMILSIIIILLKNNLVINLKFTKRVIRLLITYIFLLIFTLIVSKYKLQTLSIIYLLNPFILIIINFINLPFELLVKHYYQKKASKKLLKNKNLIKIAITGSFGKTSTKNILKNILENKYITTSTPKSYNTLMGLSKTINDNLNNQTEIFIAEMGAYRLKEIDKMTKFIKPDIGVICDIGYQHMETFKTLENVKTAKFELINRMAEKTYAIINKDALLIDEESLKKKKTYFFSEQNKSGVYASDIKIHNGKTTFKINYKENIVEITTQLLGKHNIKNILASYCVILALREKNINITDSEFSKIISNIRPLNHRLSYEKVDNLHIYDDAYNSNKNGFINSIEVIKNIPLKKVIITPGIVDLGKMTEEINKEVARHIKNVFDDIYIIDSYSGIYIYKELEYLNNVTLVKSFKDAYLQVLSKYKTEEIALLIENDLPDNYLARRRKK